MLLTIDIGNTVVTLGVFDGDRLVTTFRVSTDSRRLADEYGLQLVNLLHLRGIDPSQITAACICSGVPPLTVVFNELCRTYFNVTALTVSAASAPDCASSTIRPGTWGPTVLPTQLPLLSFTLRR